MIMKTLDQENALGCWDSIKVSARLWETCHRQIRWIDSHSIDTNEESADQRLLRQVGRLYALYF